MMPEFQPNQYQYYPAPKAPKYYTLLSNIMTYNIHVSKEDFKVAHESTANMKALAKSQLPNKADSSGELEELFQIFPGLKAKGDRKARRQLSEEARDVIAKVSAEKARSKGDIDFEERTFFTLLKRGDPDLEGSNILEENRAIANIIDHGTAADRGKLVEAKIYETMKYFDIFSRQDYTDEYIVKNFEDLYSAQDVIANAAAFLDLAKSTKPDIRIEISDECKEILKMMELHSPKCDIPLQRARAIANANYELVDHNYIFNASNAEVENLKQYLEGDEPRVSSMAQYDLLVPMAPYRQWSKIGHAVNLADKILSDFAKEPKAPMVKGLDTQDNPYTIQCSTKTEFTDIAGNFDGYAIAYTDQKATCYHMERSGRVTQVDTKDMLNNMPGEIDAALKILQDANKGLFIGSKEFSDGLKAMSDLSKKMHLKEFPLVGDNITKLQLQTTMEACQAYLDKKNPEKADFDRIEFNNAREQHRYLAMQQAIASCQRQLNAISLQEEAIAIETKVAANQMRAQAAQWKYQVPNTKEMTTDQFFNYVKSIQEQADDFSVNSVLTSKDCTPEKYYTVVTQNLEAQIASEVYREAVLTTDESKRTQILEAYKEHYTAMAIGLGDFVVKHTNKDHLAAHCRHPQDYSAEYNSLTGSSDNILFDGVKRYMEELKAQNAANAPAEQPKKEPPKSNEVQQEIPELKAPQQGGLHN
jgi:hypothetical protein